jgi:hypothetical protein
MVGIEFPFIGWWLLHYSLCFLYELFLEKPHREFFEIEKTKAPVKSAKTM